jgi:hypothetical protein
MDGSAQQPAARPPHTHTVRSSAGVRAARRTSRSIYSSASLKQTDAPCSAVLSTPGAFDLVLADWNDLSTQPPPHAGHQIPSQSLTSPHIPSHSIPPPHPTRRAAPAREVERVCVMREMLPHTRTGGLRFTHRFTAAFARKTTHVCYQRRGRGGNTTL